MPGEFFGIDRTRWDCGLWLHPTIFFIDYVCPEREEAISKQSKKSRSNQAKKPNDRIGELEADNKKLKADINQLNNRIDQLDADNKQLKADNKQLKADNKQHDVSLKVSFFQP